MNRSAEEVGLQALISEAGKLKPAVTTSLFVIRNGSVILSIAPIRVGIAEVKTSTS